ncbi:MAG: DUF4271 domain-containing protein [Muribaculaceae bacterium]|nr:DUF4271 domain-containing protein [Muribaculaceae bacterium]
MSQESPVISPFSYTPPVQADTSQVLQTVIVDSIAADTVSGRIPHFIPTEVADSLRAEELVLAVAQTEFKEKPSGLREGILPTARTVNIGDSSAVSALFMAVMVAACLNAPHIGRALKSYWGQLWSLRRRPNVFDSARSVSTVAAALLATIYIVFGGTLLHWLPGVPQVASFAALGSGIVLFGAYYVFQLVAYRTVGYAFGSKEQSRQWLNGFSASQAFAALPFIPAALLAVYCPTLRYAMIITGLGIYGLARVIFIAKGFRIFYAGISSLLYFILYLCTLEILPLLVLYSLAVNL